ncbi:hypothetical protein U3A58_08635 [Algoriphagus sp. C2-6-M1]|uniref:hypothetical protein n=1 Tax=Algoriphagus persicinus TaxID=3108754 RepID=UPI002B37C010|nr:hypothetical protein [Algoriphagus sp. C2-6-M1]MEB2780457.1 hypothetical protein [Algoriphagus sp. C2-6-M1]
MVVRINNDKNLMGILRYNELKKETGDAKLLKISGMLPGAEKLTSYQLAKQFRTFTDLNSRTHTGEVLMGIESGFQEEM